MVLKKPECMDYGLTFLAHIYLYFWKKKSLTYAYLCYLSWNLNCKNYSEVLFCKGDFLDFLCTIFNTASSDSTVSEDAGIERRTVATTALAVWRSNHSARSHPPRLDLSRKGNLIGLWFPKDHGLWADIYWIYSTSLVHFSTEEIGNDVRSVPNS